MPRYQYQPITGPVWRAPVAESLSWLPQGTPVAPRALPGVTLALVAASFFAAVTPSYDPATLTWQPRGQYPSRAPAATPWNDNYSFGAPVYDPQDLAWLASATSPLRVVVPVRAGPTVLSPFPVAPSYDPAQLAWQPQGRDRTVRGPLAAWNDTFSFGAPVYDPQELAWQPAGHPRIPQALPRAAPAATVLSPLPITPIPFDPAHLAWEPRARVVPRQLPAPPWDDSLYFGAPVLPDVVPTVVVPTAPQGGKSKGKKSFYEPVPRRKLAVEPFLRLEREPEPTPPPVPAMPVTQPAPPAPAPRELAPIVLPKVPPRAPLPAYIETLGIEPNLRASMETLARFVPRRVPDLPPPVIELPGVSDDEDLEDLLTLRAALAHYLGG